MSISPSTPDPLPTPDYAVSLPKEPAATESLGAWLRFLLPVLIGVPLDLYSKSWAQKTLASPLPSFEVDDRIIIPGILNFRYTINRGAVFGIGQGLIPLFALFSIIALAVILYIYVTSRRKQIFLHLALGLITAGAIGNFYDRIVYRQVRDFMLLFPSTKIWPWIFNVADVMLCIGVPLLMLCWITQPIPKKSPQ